jgi:hypothetical protein
VKRRATPVARLVSYGERAEVAPEVIVVVVPSAGGRSLRQWRG